MNSGHSTLKLKYPLFRWSMEGMYTKDDLRLLLSPMYLGPQKENDLAETVCLIHSRHEQDSCKASSDPAVNRMLSSLLLTEGLYPHIVHRSENLIATTTAVGDPVSTGPSGPLG